MQIDTWSIVFFIIMWALGPATQVLQLIASQLRYKLGMMEKAAFEPEFKWFRLNERGPHTPISPISSQELPSFGWRLRETKRPWSLGCILARSTCSSCRNTSSSSSC